MIESASPFAELLTRIILGILFFAQGFDKVFHIGIAEVTRGFEQPASKYKVPVPVVTLVSALTSFSELIGGFLLLIGFMKYPAMYVLGIDMLLVAASFSLIRPMWDMQYFMPRLSLLIALLLFPEEWGKWSLDYIINH
jgi:putative oxidoreductase